MLPVTGYTHHSPAALLDALDDLLDETFGLRFAAWRAMGGWTDDYTGCAILEGGRMLANAGLYRMRLRVEGRALTAWQVGAVATRAGYRGQGLSRRVIEHLLARLAGQPVFLLAHPGVVDFYPRFGFRRVSERQPVIYRSLDGAPGAMRRLSAPAAWDARLDALLRGPGCASGLLDCANAAPLHWFHLLQGTGGGLYEIPDLGALVAAEQEGAVLHLAQAWSAAPLGWDELAARLDFPGVEVIRFGFNPDALAGAAPRYPDCPADSTLFALGECFPRGAFVFPWLLRT